MTDINLFDLFGEAVLDHIEANSGERELTQQTREAVRVAYDAISAAFFAPEPIDYAAPDRTKAYMFYHAPKHAYIWKRYVRNRCKKPCVGSVTLNSYGTGPASELIGLAEAWRARGLKRIEAYCYDRLDAWRPLAQAVAARYSRETNFELELIWVDDSDGFAKGRHLVGSFVLSELVRRKEIDALLRLHSDIPGTYATFLDGAKVATVDGDRVLKDVASFDYWTYLPSLGLDCFKEINAAFATRADRVCGHELKEEPKLCFFRTRY